MYVRERAGSKRGARKAEKMSKGKKERRKREKQERWRRQQGWQRDLLIWGTVMCDPHTQTRYILKWWAVMQG
jgi:hypothetical protein